MLSNFSNQLIVLMNHSLFFDQWNVKFPTAFTTETAIKTCYGKWVFLEFYNVIKITQGLVIPVGDIFGMVAGFRLVALLDNRLLSGSFLHNLIEKEMCYKNTWH